MTMQELINICLNCLGYAYEQVSTSEIDVLGLAFQYPNSYKDVSIDKILNAYEMLDSMTPKVHYEIPESVRRKHFGGEA